MSARMPIPFVSQSDPAAVASWLQALRAAMPEEEIIAFSELDEDQRAQCRVAIVANPDPAQLKLLPQLQWVHSVWAGVERLVADLGQSDLQITRLVDPRLAATMAEAVLAWTLYLHRDMPYYARQQQARQWQPLDYVLPEQRRVGILGLGALGEAAAAALRQARFPVMGWSRSARNLPDVQTYSGMDGLAQMLAQTDILVCLLPLTAQTRALLDAARLAMLPPQAQLINFARGPIIEEEALPGARCRQDASRGAGCVRHRAPAARGMALVASCGDGTAALLGAHGFRYGVGDRGGQYPSLPQDR
jgi:glyoxylate/hydroxypyruvate reductase A